MLNTISILIIRVQRCINIIILLLNARNYFLLQRVKIKTLLTILNSLPEAATQLIYDTSIPWSEKKRILKQLRNELPFVVCFAVYPIHELQFYLRAFFVCAKHNFVTAELLCAYINIFRMWIIKQFRCCRDIAYLGQAQRCEKNEQ